MADDVISFGDFKLPTIDADKIDFQWVAAPWGLFCLKCNKEITENVNERCESRREWKVQDE